MKTVTRAVCVLVCLAVWLSGVGQARAWSMPSWLPGGSSSSPKKPAVLAAKKNSPKRTPGMVDSISSTPKKLYSSTKAMLAPAKNSKSPIPKRSVSNQAKSQSTLKSWFAPPEPKQPRTVVEWMSQKRVEP